MAYKIFANGSPLPASDLNTYLMNQSVMVFASSTARDAVLTAPVEGMLTYLEADEKLYLYTGSAWELQNPITTQGDLIVGGSGGVPSRLGIGANGQVLASDGTTAEWVDAVSGGLALISSSSLSGSSVSITSIPGTFKYLLLTLEGVQGTVGEFVQMRFNNDSGSNYKSGTTTTTQIDVAILGTTGNSNAMIEIGSAYKASAADLPVFSSNASSTFGLSSRNDRGAYLQSAAVTSIQLFPQTGSFTAGTYNLYGAN